MKRNSLASILFFAPALALAAVDTMKTPTNVGAETNRAYFRVAEGLSFQCANLVVYIDTTTASGKLEASLVLETKALGKRLSVVGYTPDANGLCWAYSLEMEP